ncbi:MAG TPA: rhomboid family intramembrane serine protease [Terriglobales bacterium]|jgi:membrane associated rhomboid family serine protease|nr:rhomboid family intramembrane serine protease [Terriglobales bacterium]
MIPLRDDQPTFSTPFVNYFLIALNIVIFLWEWSLGTQNHRALNSFLFQFGVVPHHMLAVLSGQSSDPIVAGILPLFTSMFLHGSFLHVAGNMLFLWIFGDNVEDHLGHFNYLVFYLLSGVAAAITHILLNLNSRLPTVGASGAIAGVMGAYFILYPRARVLTWFFVFVLWLPAWLVLGYWFLLQFVAVPEIAATGVAVWAHLGGFAAGVILIKIFPERSHRYRYGTW